MEEINVRDISEIELRELCRYYYLKAGYYPEVLISRWENAHNKTFKGYGMYSKEQAE